MTGPTGAGDDVPPLPPELERYGPWGPSEDVSGRAARSRASGRPGRRSNNGAEGARRWWTIGWTGAGSSGRSEGTPRRAIGRPERRSSSAKALVSRRPALRWSPVATAGAALGGAIGTTTAMPLALAGGSPSATAGWWVLGATSAAVCAWGTTMRLGLASFGPEGARRRALEKDIWSTHTREVPGGVVVDAPGQQRWRFSSALGAVERRVAGVPSPDRTHLLREARTVAIAASQLLRDAPTLGQARLTVFPEARFGRLDLTADDSLVPGAGAAYRRLLDDAEQQLHELAEALGDLAQSSARGAAVSEGDVHRLHALVSLAELEADPATRGPEPAIVLAAERLRARAAAERELDA